MHSNYRTANDCKPSRIAGFASPLPRQPRWNGLPALLCLVGLCLRGAPVQAGEIGFCTGTDASGEAGTIAVQELARLETPERLLGRLVSAEVLPGGCVASGVRLPAGAEIKARILAPELAPRLQDGFGLIRGADREGDPRGELLPRGVEGAGPPRLALGRSLLPQLLSSTYGAEGRAQLRSGPGGVIELECAPGGKPAGAMLRLAEHVLPPGRRLRLRLRFDASTPFEVLASDAQRAERGDPFAWMTLGAGQADVAAEMPRERLQGDALHSLTVACPKLGGRLSLGSLSAEDLTPPNRASGRALWIWQPSRWQQEATAVLDEARRAGADQLFVTVPVDLENVLVRDASALGEFIARAAGQGIRIWAVIGDPQAVLGSQRERFALRAAAYERYNAAAAPSRRLAGLQLDVEPYLERSYGVDPLPWHAAYVRLVRKVRERTQLPLDLAVPFWWNDAQTAGGRLLDELAGDVTSLTVMNYRTEPGQILAAAQPFLDWSLRHGRAVRIALEAGRIQDEQIHHFRPARQGELALFTVANYPVLLASVQPLALPGTTLFARTHATRFGGERITFHGRQDELLRQLVELERLWRAWPGFAGVALHEYRP